MSLNNARYAVYPGSDMAQSQISRTLCGTTERARIAAIMSQERFEPPHVCRKAGGKTAESNVAGRVQTDFLHLFLRFFGLCTSPDDHSCLSNPRRPPS